MKLRKIINDPPDNYYSKLAQVESSNNPLAKAKTSSAAGLYQFTEGTWNQLTGDLGLNYTLEDRFNPQKSRKVVEEFTKRNERSLKKRLGRQPNEAELYLAHFSGAGGAGKLLDTISKNPNTPVTQFVSKGALKANKSIFYNKDGSPKKAYEIYNWSAKKFDSPLMESDKEEAVEELANEAVAPMSREEQEARQIVVDNTAVVSPNYATLPELAKVEEDAVISQQEAIQKQQQVEAQSTQNRFANVFQQQEVQEEPEYNPQAEDLSHLYNYINIDSYADGGEKGCGGPGQPPCPPEKVSDPNDPRIQKYRDSLDLFQKGQTLLRMSEFRDGKHPDDPTVKNMKDVFTKILVDAKMKERETGIKPIESYATSPSRYAHSGELLDGDDAKYFIKKNKTKLKTIGVPIYKQPTQPVEYQKAPSSRQEQDKVDGISEGVQISDDVLSGSIAGLRAPSPKYWEVEIQSNHGLGSTKTKRTITSLAELEKLRRKQKADEQSATGKNNKLIITPKYK